MVRESKKEESIVSIGAVVDVVLEVKPQIAMVLGLNLNPGIVVLLLSFLGLNDLLLCPYYQT
jgi:hypothetical protein